jgi:hypothetical protein
MKKYKYEIRQIEAWIEPCYEIMPGETEDYTTWTWNESWHICDFLSSATDMKRAFLRKLSSIGVTFSVPVKVDYDGSIYEIQRKDNNMPLFALIPVDF